MNGLSLDSSLLSLLLPIVIGILAVAFITLPFWSGSSRAPQLRRAAHVVSREQLELDHELGKIDEAEYKELDALLPRAEPTFGSAAVESLVGAFRRRRQLDLSVETEVLVARARRQTNSIRSLKATAEEPPVERAAARRER